MSIANSGRKNATTIDAAITTGTGSRLRRTSR